MFPLPSFANVKQVSHHPEEHLCGANGTVVICRHLMANEILALLSSQLLSFTKCINVDIVIDVFTPVGQRRTYTYLYLTLTLFRHGIKCTAWDVVMHSVHGKQINMDSDLGHKKCINKSYPLCFWHQRSKKWLGKLTGSR